MSMQKHNPLAEYGAVLLFVMFALLPGLRAALPHLPGNWGTCNLWKRVCRFLPISYSVGVTPVVAWGVVR